MGHPTWCYTSEAFMAKQGKKRERSESGEKEQKKKKPKHLPLACAVCEDKGVADVVTLNHNQELLGQVASKQLEERYWCLRCHKPTDRAGHVSE